MKTVKLITKKAVKHSSRGDFTYKKRKPIRMKSGGHGQENIKYLIKNNLDYTIKKEYSNGVRFGNIINHINKRKRSEGMQAWFPRKWAREDIEKAGNHVRSLKKNANPIDGKAYMGRYKGVSVGIINRNKKIVTIFPCYDVNKGAKKKAYEKNRKN